MGRPQGRARRLGTILGLALAVLATAVPSAGARPKPTPRLAFVNASNELRVVGADGRGERRIATAGRPLTEVSWDHLADPAWSPNGKLVAYGRNIGTVMVAERAELRVVGVDGSDDTLLVSVPAGIIHTVRWSPDGRHLAFVLWTPNPAVAAATWTDYGGRWDLYLIDADGSGLRNVAPVHASYSGHIDFSPDGSRLAFISDQQGLRGVYTVDVADASLPVRLSPPDIMASYPAWSPNGKRLVYAGTSVLDMADLTAPELWAIDADGSNPVRLPVRSWAPVSWSPDGKRLVYASANGLKTIGANGRGPRTLTSGNDYGPVWSRHGQIAFIRSEKQCCGRTLWVMNANGSNRHRVTWADRVDVGLAWSK